MIDLAIACARSNTGCDRAQMAAVIARRNKVKAIGYNQYKSHPLQAKFAISEKAIYLHAEIDAFANYLRVYDLEELSKCTMYVARVLKDGTPALAKPCAGCQQAIASFEIGNVVWTE